jgi:hypothetical protein
MIVYNDLDDFRKIYTYNCKIALQEKNEIVVISRSYETPEEVKKNLEKAGVYALKHISQGSSLIVDAMRSFRVLDVNGLVKLLTSLDGRAHKEGKKGTVCFGDVGTFFC